MTTAEAPLPGQTADALEIARGLARAGIPIFIAPPSSDPKDTSGFRLPSRWQQTQPDPAILDHWRPGWAVCAVMGHGIDLVDLDLYAGAETDKIMAPLVAARHYGTANTASGGIHVFVASLGVRSKNGLFKGIDIKAGDKDGKGHGFAFIAPTVKPSKITGELSPYYWETPPDLAALAETGQDTSGQALAALLAPVIPPEVPLPSVNGNGQAPVITAAALADSFRTARTSPWGRYNAEKREHQEDILATLASSGRNNGVMRLAAALRGQGGWELEAAIAHMYEHIWPLIDQGQGAHEFPAEEFEATIRAQWRQYPDGVLRAIEVVEEHAESTEWPVPGSVLELSDAYVTDTVERCCLRGKFLWARGMNWLRWTGLVWAAVDIGIVHDHLSRGFREWYATAARRGAEPAVLSKMATLLGMPKIRAIIDLVHGHPLITHEAEDFDAYPDMVNTPECIVDLRSGETWPNDPRWMLTKITSGRYVPGFTHEDWEQALTALNPPERAWFKARIGQAITGHPPSDGIMPVLQGSGENAKALDLNTPMLTANRGWTTMGDLAEGDEVYGPDGQPAKIIGAHPVRYNRPCYRVTTTDGRSVIADAEHLWTVRSFQRTHHRKLPRQMVLTTEQLLAAGPVARTRGTTAEFRFRLPVQQAIQAPAVDLLLDPYVLGAWLGDGDTAGNGFTCHPDDAEILEQIRAAGWPVRPLTDIRGNRWGIGNGHGGPKAASFKAQLRKLGVLGNKHIPESYLNAGTGQRLALLQGLMDTDGTCSHGQGQASFCTIRQVLADDVLYLIRSLGWRVTAKESAAKLHGREVSRVWRLAFTPRGDMTPFRLTRKAAQIRTGSQGKAVSIARIEPVPSRPVRCITVDRDDALYLAGRDLIPTHNTALTTDGPVRALGDYADMASHKLISAHRPGVSEHSTELADLRGQRLLIGEELAEGRSLDVTALKRIQDVGRIKARYVHKDNITFTASHSLFVTTNYIPVINETDHGTWRRLALLKFRYTYRKTAAEVIRPTDRLADPGIKQRIRQNLSGQHDAIVTWAIEGARDWYRGNFKDAPVTGQISKDTLAWREESDRILGFCTAKLEPDHNACILATDMVDQFNAWLSTNGHSAWSKETFVPRFAGHDWTTRNGVENRRTAALSGLVLWPIPGGFQARKGPPKQAVVWMGVRPRTQDDQGGDGQVAEVAEVTTKLSDDSRIGEFVKGSATAATQTDLSTPEGPSVSGSPATAKMPQRDDGTSPPSGQAAAEPAASRPPENVTQSSENGNPPQAEKPPRAKKPRVPKPPRREGSDPQLAGRIFTLPAAVTRSGDVKSCPIEVATALASCPELTVDVETTGYPIGHPDYALRTVQLGDENYAVVFDAADPAQQAVIRQVLAGAQILHAHSAVADLVPLVHAGLCGEEAWLRMDDTVLHAKLADPHMSGSDADGLKRLAGDVLQAAVSPDAEKAKNALFASGKWLVKTDALTPVEKSGWAQVDPYCETMIRYAASDVLDTAALPRALPAVDPVILERERAVQRVCSVVSHRGLRLDQDHIRAKLAEHRAGREEAAAQLQDHWGVSNANSKLEVPAAFERLGVALGRTKPSATYPDGQASSASAELEPIAAGDGPGAELAKAVLGYRHHATALALLLEPMDVLCSRGDGRVYPSIYTIEAGTGRMSSRRMNLQQFSRQGGMRACISADEGMMGVSADFSSVEVRVGAGLSGDEGLKELIRNAGAYPDRKKEFDLHWIAARMVWGPDATKENRYVAKRIIFSKMYGGAAAAGARQTGVPEQAAQAVHDAFAQIAPQFVAWSDWMRREVASGRMTYFTAYSGRPIWLPRNASHAAGNYAIQGTAREFLADGLLSWSQTRWGGGVVVPIHDEIVTFAPADEAQAATAQLVACMANELNGVQITAEASEPWTSWPDAS